MLAGCEASFIGGRSHIIQKHGLLFKQAFSDLNHLSNAQQTHSKSQTHVNCYTVQIIWKKQMVDLLYDARR